MLIHSLDIVNFPCGNFLHHHFLHTKHNQMSLAKGEIRKELKVASCFIAASLVFSFLATQKNRSQKLILTINDI